MGAWRTAASLGIGVAGGMALFNAIQGRQAGPLMSEVPGETRYWPTRLGSVFYKTSGDGPPLVILHGFHAGASSYEMRRQVGPLAGRFRVYAPDWLGFGLSDRPAIRYTAQVYIDLLEGFIRDVVREPAHVIASSLAGAYVIDVAARVPDLFRRLLLIAPTGLTHLVSAPDEVQAGLRHLVASPLLGTAAFNLLARRPSLRYYLAQQAYSNPACISGATIDAYYATTHQPGARHAPASFISGALNRSVKSSWPQVTHPTLLVWGRDATSTPVTDAEAFLALRPEARLEIFDHARLLPNDEHADRFNALAADFLSDE